MSKFLVVIFAVLLFSSPAWALLDDDHSINQDQTNVSQNSNHNSSDSSSRSSSESINSSHNTNIVSPDQKTIVDSKQATSVGQLGVVGQSASNNQDTTIGGDTNKTYANAWPSLSGGEGVSQANAYSLFGGLGLSNAEAYKKLIIQIQAIEASETLTADQKRDMVVSLFSKMIDTNKKQRFLGLFWETSGRNLLNLFGILSWDSFWKENQHPFTK